MRIGFTVLVVAGVAWCAGCRTPVQNAAGPVVMVPVPGKGLVAITDGETLRERVIALGESGSTNATPELERFYLANRRVAPDRADRYLDAEILIALSLIPGPAARNLHDRILAEAVALRKQREPHTVGFERYHASCDVGIRIVAERGDPESLELLERIAEVLPDYTDRWILWRRMRDAGITSSDARVRWLYSEYMKATQRNDEPVRSLLRDMGVKALRPLIKLRKEVEAEHGAEYWGTVWLGVMIRNLEDEVHFSTIPKQPGLPYWRDKDRPKVL